MDFRSRFRALSNTIKTSWPAPMRILGLWVSLDIVLNSLGGARHGTSKFQRLQEGQPRAFPLYLVSALSGLPLAILWAAILRSFMGHPEFRKWMLGGAAVGFLGPMGLGSWFEGVGVLLEMDLARMMGCIGFGVGYMLCGTNFAKWLDPKLMEQGEEIVVLDREQDEVEVDRGNVEKSGSKVDDYNPPIGTSTSANATEESTMYILALSWFAAGLCGNVSEDAFLTLERELKRYEVIISTTALVAALGVYSLVLYCFVRNTKDTSREFLSGLAIGVVSLASLRLTAPDSSWQYWAIDSVLAFVGANIGMLGGGYLRRR